MRGLRAAFPCCTEHIAHFGGPKYFCNISCYRKDMRQTLRARYFLGFDTLQVVAFRYVCFFVCLFFSRRVPGLGFRVGVCKCVGAVWIMRANSALQYLAPVTQLCCSSPWEWGHLLVPWLHPCPTSLSVSCSLQTRRSLLEHCPAPLNLDCTTSKWGRRNLISAAKLCRRGKLPSKHSRYSCLLLPYDSISHLGTLPIPLVISECREMASPVIASPVLGGIPVIICSPEFPRLDRKGNVFPPLSPLIALHLPFIPHPQQC